MAKKKIVTILGARPHFIKAAGVSDRLRKSTELEEIIVLTGQHYDPEMSSNFIKEFNLPKPKYDLSIGSGTQAYHYARILEKLSPVLAEEKPDLVIVYGDTNSTAAATLAASFLNIPVAHIEAGLREFDRSIPEEKNKLVTDALSTIYFVPTPTGIENLTNENITKNVHLVGDVVIDYITSKQPKAKKHFDSLASTYDLSYGDYILMTVHRASTTSDLVSCENILDLAQEQSRKVIFPVHPRFKSAMEEYGLKEEHYPNIQFIHPQGFWDLQGLLYGCDMVFTDSGGLSKEAHIYHKKTLILQPQIEWTELVESGWAKLSDPTDFSSLYKATSSEWQFKKAPEFKLGSAERIVEIIEELFIL